MKKNSKSRFWFGYRIYMGILVILVAVLLINVWNIMKKYQAAQPENVVESFVKRLESGDTSDVTMPEESKFEPDAYSPADFSDSVKNKELSYEVRSKDSDRIVYNIKNGDEDIVELTLSASGNRHLMMILAISDWKIEEAEALIRKDSVSADITVPESYSVYINGVQTGSEEMRGEPEAAPGMDFVAEYVDSPCFVTYHVDGLTRKPDIKVTDQNGEDVDISAYVTDSDIRVPYQTSEMPDDIKDYVIKAAKDYSNFFSRDLAGCSESTACLQPYFPEKSYYIELAEQYRTGDMWMYSAHQTPVFDNIEASEYTVYSDDCFSCRVTFDKSMILKNGEKRTEHNDQVYYYVKIDGNWLIADMKS